MKKQVTKKPARIVRDLPVRDEKEVKGGGFSIGKALGSVVSAPFKAVAATV